MFEKKGEALKHDRPATKTDGQKIVPPSPFNRIRDCIDRTGNAMTQAHCFKAAEISLNAQLMADTVEYFYAANAS